MSIGASAPYRSLRCSAIAAELPALLAQAKALCYLAFAELPAEPERGHRARGHKRLTTNRRRVRLPADERWRRNLGQF